MEQDKVTKALSVMANETNAVVAVGQRADEGDGFVLLKGDYGGMGYAIYTAIKHFAQQYDSTFLEIFRMLLLTAVKDGWLKPEELEVAGVESGEAGEIISKLKKLVKEIQNGSQRN